MNELFSLLLYAIFLGFIIRVTCGTHVIHGSHHQKPAKSIAPVWGIEVSNDKGFGKTYHEKEYRFCSHNGLIKVDDTSHKYLNSKGDTL